MRGAASRRRSQTTIPWPDNADAFGIRIGKVPPPLARIKLTDRRISDTGIISCRRRLIGVLRAWDSMRLQNADTPFKTMLNKRRMASFGGSE